mgnify:CR=1 FL=1
MDVLYVDDEPSFLEQTKIFLEKERDLKVDTAGSASDGLNKLRENEYDAVISDYQMPEIDGLEFLRKVREERESNIPFIIFTGKGREEVAMEALNLGADRYLQKGGKPRIQYGILADAVSQEIKHRRMEKESEKSRKKFEAGFNVSPNLIFFLDENGVFEEVNENAREILGFEESEIVGTHLSEAPFLSEEARKTMTKQFEKRVNGENIPPYLINMITKTGDIFLVEIDVGKLEYDGDFQGEIVIAQDVTSQKVFDDKYQLATEESANGIFVFQEEGFTFANEAFVEMSGYSFSELKDLDISDVVHTDYEEVEDWVKQVLSGEGDGVPEEVEVKALPEEGGPIWVKVASSFVKYGDEEAIVGNVVDITEKKEAKERLKEAKRNYEEIFEKSADAVFIHDPDTAEILDVNQRACEMYDYSREEILNMDIENLASGESPYTQKEAEKWVQKAKFGDSQKFEWRAEKKDGTLFWVEVTLKNAEINGNERVLASVRDISERKEAEEKLKESREKYRILVEQSRDGIYIYRGDSIIFANDVICDVFGYSREELYDMKIWDLVHPEDRKNMIKMGQKRFDSDKSAENVYETRAVTKEGEVKNIEVSIREIEYKGNGAALGVVRDITKRKEKEEELRTMKNSVESSIDGIVIGDPEGNLRFVNSSFLEMWDYSEKNQVLDKDFVDFWKDENKIQSVIKKAEAQGKWRGKLIAEREDGSTFPVEATASIVKDERGEIVAVMFSFRDITERKEVEEREEFLHSLLRHDLKNKVQVVLGYHELLEESDLSEEEMEYLEFSDRNLKNSLELIEKVRTLREVGQESVDKVNLESVIEDAIKKRRSQVSEDGINIEKEVDGQKVRAGSLLDELFSNLIDNSIRHSDCEKIRVNVNNGAKEEKCLVTVEDDGSGIPDEKKEKIFEKGFKEGESKGSGLGTYLVKEIAESNGGSVDVNDSELGGARFDVYLESA